MNVEVIMDQTDEWKKSVKGIESYIDFGPSKYAGLIKVRMASLKGKAVRVLSWEIKKSKYPDTGSESGLYSEIVGEFPDSGDKWLFCTGSDIVREQLQRIGKAKAAAGEDDMSFACMFESNKRFCKMVPAREGE